MQLVLSQAEEARSIKRVGGRSVAGDDPQPHRPVRRERADHPAPGRPRHPDPAARHPGSAARQGADRQDRAAGVQAGARRATPEPYRRRQRSRCRPARSPLRGRQGQPTGERKKGQPLLVESQHADDRRRRHRRARAARRPAEQPHRRRWTSTPRGARLFDEITGANVNRRLAIVLDDTVYSAPVIRERIGGGQARRSAAASRPTRRGPGDRAARRRAAGAGDGRRGAHRRAEPRAGLDPARASARSSSAARWSSLFMLVYYRFAGLLADLALIWNVLFLLAALAAFGATLTLPGIAGIVLTLGMAVDANVLINERIREELRLGKIGARRHRGGLRARPAVDPRHPHHDLPVRAHPVPVRLRTDQGLRRDAVHRPGRAACSRPSSAPAWSGTTCCRAAGCRL